jgi:hypothetical protein
MMITRRHFNLTAAGAALSIPLSSAISHATPTPEAQGSSSDGGSGSAFTPFGYLDNPYHCWNLHPSGVFRSVPGVGFGVYYPAGPGGYFDYRRNGVYHALLRIGFVIDGRTVFAFEDFRVGELASTHHSKDVFTYRVSISGFRLDCTFFQSGEDTLAARVRYSADNKRQEALSLIVQHEYQLGGAHWWGGDGVAAYFDPVSDAWITHGFAAGTVFATGADCASGSRSVDVRKEPQQSSLAFENRREATAYGTDPMTAILSYDVTPSLMNRGITIHMSRGVNRKAALKELNRSKSEARGELDRKYSNDAKFWEGAPRLTGDWPPHWKNGWVYDYETLRMMVRRPIGMYRHPWDAMQIQAPRNVLAETSIDMWALSYVDPAAAKAVFVGQFLDAIAPNVPCAREDGVANMVATDGSECGTSISWCYPFFCALCIYQRTGDRDWLALVYGRLVAFLCWTLESRSDNDKFIISKCSWESGMDGSKRFLINEPTGGETADFARLVELQAATSHAAGVLAYFANELGKRAEVEQWRVLESTYSSKTQQMWNGRDWFNDFDTRSMQPITSVGHDVGQVAPIFCEIASSGQIQRMLPVLRAFYEDSKAGNIDGGQDPLIWSSLLLPYVESLWSAHQLDLVSEVVHSIAERIYTSMDRRNLSSDEKTHLGWPGISCEIWGPVGACGGEGYGWGAVMPAHIIRNLLGVRETGEPGSVILAPNLPHDLITKGGEYGINNLAFRRGKLSLRYKPTGQDSVQVTGACSAGMIVVEDTANDARVTGGASRTFSFTARNRHVYRLVWHEGPSAS